MFARQLSRSRVTRAPWARSKLGTATAGGLLIGIGMGAFVDGILLHQILQWHNMLSTVLPPTDLPAMEVNMRWDGYFHAAVWAVTVTGLFLLWEGARRARTRPGGLWLLGLMLIGWGAFNFVEGLIDHHVLGIHHVRGWGPDPAWDLGFLATGPALAFVGWRIARRAGVTATQDPS